MFDNQQSSDKWRVDFFNLQLRRVTGDAWHPPRLPPGPHDTRPPSLVTEQTSLSLSSSVAFHNFKLERAEHQSNSCEAQKPDVPCAADALNDVKALWCSEWFPRVSRSSVNQPREGEPHSVAMDGIRDDLTVPDLQFLGMHVSSAALEEASNEDFFSTEVKFHLGDEFTSTLAYAVLKYGSVAESASRITRGMRECILGNTQHQEGLPFQEVLHVKRALAALLDVTTKALSSMGRDWEHAKRLSFGDANLFSEEQFNSSTSTSE